MKTLCASGLLCAALATSLAVASPAAAQVSDEILQATAGDWLLAPEDGRPGCHVDFRTDEVIGGYELRPAPNCASVLSKMTSAIAWRFDQSNGGLAFSGPQRETVISFDEKEDGTYASAGEPGEALLLLKAAAGVTAIPNAKDIFGTWSVMSNGSPICRVTFSDKPPEGGEESYALKLEDGCDAKLTATKLGSWRIEGLNLMLFGTDGDSFAFQPAGDGTFATEAEPPMALVRK